MADVKEPSQLRLVNYHNSSSFILAKYQVGVEALIELWPHLVVWRSSSKMVHRLWALQVWFSFPKRIQRHVDDGEIPP